MSAALVIILSSTTDNSSTLNTSTTTTETGCPEDRDVTTSFPVLSVYLPAPTPVAFKAIVSTLHTIVFLAAVSGNVLTLVSVLRAGGATRIATRALLGSLAISDIFTALLITPVEMMFLLDDMKWKIGSFLCYTVSFLQTTTIAANAFTICVIAGDRYMGIARTPSVGGRFLDGRIALVTALAGAWGAAVAVSAPQLAMYEVVTFRNVIVSVDKLESRSYCMSTWVCKVKNRQLYFTLLVALVFLPLLLLVLALYSHVAYVLWVKKEGSEGGQSSSSALRLKRRRKTAVTLVLLAILFIVCRAPNFVYIVIIWSTTIENSTQIMIIRDTLVLISLFNSALNPLLYAAHFLDGVAKYWNDFWKKVSVCWSGKFDKKSGKADGGTRGVGGEEVRDVLDAPGVAMGGDRADNNVLHVGFRVDTKSSEEDSQTPKSRADQDETAITNLPNKTAEVTESRNTVD